MHGDIVLTVAAVLAGGVACQWLGWRLKVPSIVFLLTLGLLVGPVLSWMDPNETFGDGVIPFVTIAVYVVLFEGALGLGWRGMRRAGPTVVSLLTVGAAITIALTTLLAILILDVDWQLAVLIAAVLVVTGPTVIGPLVRSIGLRGRVGSILEAEGTLIDPIGAILTVVAFESFFLDLPEGRPAIVEIGLTLGIGAALGALAALLLTLAFGNFVIPGDLHNVVTLATVIAAAALADEIQPESGLVAVTVMGIVMASQRRVTVRHILEFNETLRIALISGLFILLGARIQPETLRELEWRNIVFMVALVLVVRPISVAAATLGSTLTRAERGFLAGTAPRGIVAAAIASIFSLRLEEAGVDDGQALVSVTFTVILGTVLVSGLGGRRLAIRLGLAAPQQRTVVILGANAVTRELAAGLERQRVAVRLVDLDRRSVLDTRKAGLSVHRASILSDGMWEEVDVEDAAAFLAMTSSDELNALAARDAVTTLGSEKVFQAVPRRPEHREWWKLPAGALARPLFARDANLDLLSGRIGDGWSVRATRLSEKYGLGRYEEDHPDRILLFVIDGKGKVNPVACDTELSPRPGDIVMSLLPPESPPEAAP